MKSNIEYLREDIKQSLYIPVPFANQLLEWIDAIEGELKVDKKSEADLEDCDDRDETISELQEELEEYQDRLQEIDCGIGKIQYLKPDNIKLQCLMDDFKEQHERSKQTLQLYQN